MENIYVKRFPFVVRVDQKVSKANKIYTLFSVGMYGNDEDNKMTYISFFNKDDLLKLSNACMCAYNEYSEAENEEFRKTWESESKKESEGDDNGSK